MFKKIFFAVIFFLFLFLCLTGLLYNHLLIIQIGNQLKAKTQLQTVLNYLQYSRQKIQFGKYGHVPIYDHELGPLERGYGYCDQQSNFFVLLCEYHHIPARMLMLNCENEISCHTLAETKIDSIWGIFDVTYGYYFHEDSSQLIAKKNLVNHKFLLDSIFNGRYQPEFYTTGHLEYISSKRKIILQLSKFIYPLWHCFKFALQDIYLFFRTFGDDKIDKLYLKAKHYEFLNRYDQSIQIYLKILQSNQNFRKDHILFQLAYCFLQINNKKKAIQYYQKLIQLYPTSTYKNETFYYLAKLTPDHHQKEQFLIRSNYWDSHWWRFKHFRYLISNK